MMRGILQKITNHGVTTKYHSEMVMFTQKDGSGRYQKTILRGVNGHFPPVSEEDFLPAPRTIFALWIFSIVISVRSVAVHEFSGIGRVSSFRGSGRQNEPLLRKET